MLGRPASRRWLKACPSRRALSRPVSVRLQAPCLSRPALSRSQARSAPSRRMQRQEQPPAIAEPARTGVVSLCVPIWLELKLQGVCSEESQQRVIGVVRPLRLSALSLASLLAEAAEAASPSSMSPTNAESPPPNPIGCNQRPLYILSYIIGTTMSPNEPYSRPYIAVCRRQNGGGQGDQNQLPNQPHGLTTQNPNNLQKQVRET